MAKHLHSWTLVLLACGVALCRFAAQRGSVSQEGVVLRCLDDKDYAIRFLYRPPDEDVPHFPLIIRPVETKDPRYGHCSFVFPVGTTVFVSPEEMRALAKGVAQLGLVWKESPEPFSFEPVLETGPHLPGQPYRLPYQSGHGMEILATCRGGSAKADLAPERICGDLAPLDRVFHTPWAIYQFQGMRHDLGCEVPGFNPSKTPER
jgi:hypothetical protein